jgi:hypothetical protein
MAGLFERWWARITGGGPPSGHQRQSDRDEDAEIQRYEQSSADNAEQENIDRYTGDDDAVDEEGDDGEVPEEGGEGE